MVNEHVPDHALAAVRAFEDALADTRTRLARLREVEIPEVEGVSPEEMAAYAERPDASKELKAVARAVAEKRITWEDATEGRVLAAPEIAQLVEHGGPQFVAMWERGEEEDRRRAANDSRTNTITTERRDR